MRSRIEGFIYLLSNPNIDSPLNSEAANMLRIPDNKSNYNRKAFTIFRSYRWSYQHYNIFKI